MDYDNWLTAPLDDMYGEECQQCENGKCEEHGFFVTQSVITWHVANKDHFHHKTGRLIVKKGEKYRKDYEAGYETVNGVKKGFKRIFKTVITGTGKGFLRVVKTGKNS